MNSLYHSLETSRQSLHQWLDRELAQAEEQTLLRPIVEQLRKDHPRMSAREMYRHHGPRQVHRHV